MLVAILSVSLCYYYTDLFAGVPVPVHSEDKLSDPSIVLRIHHIQHNEQQIKTGQEGILEGV